MEYTIKFAKTAGYQYIELGVLSDNKTAQGLYKKMGFEEWGRLPNAFILDDGSTLDAITMYKANWVFFDKDNEMFKDE